MFTFFGAFVLLALFIVFRVQEEKKGVRIFAEARAKADTQVLKAYRGAVAGTIPQHYRVAVVLFFRHTLHQLVLLTVTGLRAAERPLTRLSHRMRMATPASKGKEPSAFLKTIAERGDGAVPPSEV